MPTAPILTDGTVILRAHRLDDATGSFEQCQDPLSQRWTTVPVPYSHADAATFVGETMAKGWADDSEWGFVVEYDGRYGGTISLRSEGNGRAELAYGSHPSIRGTGAMEKALRLLLGWGFETQGLHTVIWWAHQDNWASRKVAWRLGFTVDGMVRRWQPQRGELRDSWVGTLLRDDPREPAAPWLTPPVLDGDGVRLRPFTHQDVPRIVEACADEGTQYWLAGLPREYDEAAARAYLRSVQEKHATNAGLTWAVVEPDEDVVLGSMGIFDYAPEVECEIGFWTHAEARGRGVATRGMAVAIRHAFEGLGVQRVTAYASADNAASRHVIESNGLRPSGVERLAARHGDGSRVDLAGYDLLAEELSERD